MYRLEASSSLSIRSGPIINGHGVKIPVAVFKMQQQIQLAVAGWQSLV
jgi:hypothetical protein